MKEVNINISIAIHSKSIALFRHCLGLILVLNGLSYLIFENVRIISKHRIMAPRKSRIWPLNLFDLGGCDKLISKGYKIENLIEFPGH